MLTRWRNTVSISRRIYSYGGCASCYALESKVDANNVEFVLAPSGSHDTTDTLPSDILSHHTIWTLVFDCVRSIIFDEEGVEKAAVAFFQNDLIYQRPGGNHNLDCHLWKVVTDRFLEASAHIFGRDLDIDKLERKGWKDR
jgi:hypothetical protein